MARSRSDRPWYMQLHVQVGIALVAGFLVGLIVRVSSAHGVPAELIGDAIGLVGDIFLRLLKMIIIPLIFTSLVCGVASLGDARSVGRVGLRTVLYYALSTTFAILVGLTLVNIFQPGHFLDFGDASSLPEGLSSSSESFGSFLLNMVPDNVIGAMADGAVLPVIFFAILFGLFLVRLNGPNVEAVHRVIEGVLDIIQTLTLAIVKLAPIGIFALLAREVVHSGPGLIVRLLPYFVTVGGGLCLHAFVTLPVVLLTLARRNPVEYFRAVLPALATAFSTASSSATLPLSMECAEKEAGIGRGVSSFVLPLGATVNMDGTALYEAVAALTIAQMYGVGLSLPQQALVLLTALLASVGAAGIPMAGLVMMVVVLESVGLPIEGIATIIAVDRVLDMMRTATNVWSDLVGTAVIDRFERSAT
jgi:proton glutamate symport protein